MKRLLAVFAMSGVAVLSSGAHAAGLALRWDHCYADGGAANKVFACDTNTGNETLVGSVFLTKDAPQRAGVEILLTLATAGASLPAWWEARNPGNCRQSAANINPSIPPASVGCIDWASGNAVAGLAAYTIGVTGPTTVRIIAASAVAQENIADLSKGNEYYLFTMTISHVKTVGTGSCSGCTVPACIVFSKAKLDTQLGIPEDQAYESGINGTDSNYVTWQGGAGVSSGVGIGCPAATAVRSTTWGAVKTMYR